ncbi:hypothetical protein OG321_42240 [Streptomyces sp. NBC_00424]|nr:hypothetical protein [Streptomyces sp. NBC_00424]MCX5079018.1 hypothetical protein [Streptomyces sp. NBC_00424]
MHQDPRHGPRDVPGRGPRRPRPADHTAAQARRRSGTGRTRGH